MARDLATLGASVVVVVVAVVVVVVAGDRPVVDAGDVTVVVAPTLTTSRDPAVGLVIDRSTTNPAMTATAAAASTTTVVAGARLSPSLTARRGWCWPLRSVGGSVTW